jgi:pectin methylesterase-like acyl-CoA thioesterase
MQRRGGALYKYPKSLGGEKEKKMKTKNKTAISTLIAVTVAVSILVAFSATASADTINVGPGETYTTIQAAINAANPGDTINVADGTYTITAAINVNKGVTITGNVANPEKVVVQYSPASTSLNGFEIGAADITIQGFKIIDCFRGVHF